MTWLRWDTDTARSAVVALLAADLGVHLMQATGHYFAVVSGFGDHQPDGNVDAVPDLSLEQWAGWTGKRGRFASAFRTQCRSDGSRQDPEGTVRGWWRQRALFEKRERDSTRRKPARVKRVVPDATREKPGCDVIPSRSVVRGSSKGGLGENTLRSALPADSLPAFDQLLRAAHNPAALIGEIGALPERVRGATWAHIGIALRDLALGGRPATGLALRSFVQAAMREGERPAKTGTLGAEDDYDTAIAQARKERANAG